MALPLGPASALQRRLPGHTGFTLGSGLYRIVRESATAVVDVSAHPPRLLATSGADSMQSPL